MIWREIEKGPLTCLGQPFALLLSFSFVDSQTRKSQNDLPPSWLSGNHLYTFHKRKLVIYEISPSTSHWLSFSGEGGCVFIGCLRLFCFHADTHSLSLSLSEARALRLRKHEICKRNCLQERSKNTLYIFKAGSNDLLNSGSVLIENEGGHGANVFFSGDFFQLIDINFDENDGRILGGELINQRGDSAARTAPFGEEINNHLQKEHMKTGTKEGGIGRSERDSLRFQRRQWNGILKQKRLSWPSFLELFAFAIYFLFFFRHSLWGFISLQRSEWNQNGNKIFF